MKKALFYIQIALLSVLIASSCSQGGKRPAGDTGNDPSYTHPDDAAAVDSAAPMADTSMELNPANRTDPQQEKKDKDRTGTTDKSKKAQSVQQ